MTDGAGCDMLEDVVGRWLFVVASLAFVEAGPAAAEPSIEREAAPLRDPTAMAAQETWSDRLADKVTFFGDEVGLHLSAITFHAVALDVDCRRRLARVRLATGDRSAFAVAVDGDVTFRAGYARVAARLELAVADRSLTVVLPDVDVVPRSYDGDRYVELRIPLVDFKF